MQKNRKTLWVTICTISLVFIILGLAVHFMFKLKTVDVEIQSRLAQNETNLEEEIQDKVKNYFTSDGNIILMKFDSQISRVEKDYPYLKVNQVVKVFPNTIRVYISERIEKFKVKNAENETEWLVLDEEFKVLKAVSNDDSSVQKLIEISTTNLQTTAKTGEYVTENADCKKYINEIAVGIFGYSEDYSIVKSIDYVENSAGIDFYIRMKNVVNENCEGCLIKVQGKDKLTEKTYKGMLAFSKAISEGNLTNDNSALIIVYENDGQIIAVQSQSE